jgi:ABC-type uncharacterized transport system permease subunit
MAGAAFGAAWAFVPGYLQAKRGSHVVITTIMFNFIAAALMTYMLVNVLPPARLDGAGIAHLRGRRTAAQASTGCSIGSASNLGGAQTNISLFLALIMADLVWALIWRTRLGYRDPHPRRQTPPRLSMPACARRITVIAMADLRRAGGDDGAQRNHGRAWSADLGIRRRRRLCRHRRGADGPRSSLRRRAGGAAVRRALSGRRGACLLHAVDHPRHDHRHSGPRDPVCRRAGRAVPPGHCQAFSTRSTTAERLPCCARSSSRRSRPMETFQSIILLFDSTVRLSMPLLFAALAGLYSERSGVFDIGLEGKMLAAAFAAAAIGAVTGVVRLGAAGGGDRHLRSLLALVHGFACITARGNQIVSGVAINFLAAGLTAVLGHAYFARAATPPLPSDARFGRSTGRCRDAGGSCPSSGRSIPTCSPGTICWSISAFWRRDHLVRGLAHPLRAAVARSRREPRRRHCRRLGHGMRYQRRHHAAARSAGWPAPISPRRSRRASCPTCPRARASSRWPR